MQDQFTVYQEAIEKDKYSAYVNLSYHFYKLVLIGYAL